VRDAIQASVDGAEQELRQLQDADAETRLAVLIDGWARGVAAALEELAVAVDELERRRQTTSAPEPAEAPALDGPPGEPDDTPEEVDLRGATEAGLVDEARRSRTATAELREEGEEARRRLER
jgi:hypothetical protein